MQGEAFKQIFFNLRLDMNFLENLDFLCMRQGKEEN